MARTVSVVMGSVVGLGICLGFGHAPYANNLPGINTPAPLAFLERCERCYGTPFTMRLAGFGTLVMLTDGEAIKDVFRGDPHVLHSIFPV